MSHSSAPIAFPGTPNPMRQKTLTHLLATLSLLWLVAVFWAPALLLGVGIELHPSGHTHLYAHGHPFVDARTLWGVPNAMDVLSNLPLGLAGIMGLLALRGKQVPDATRHAMSVFFVGLMGACLGSAWYHWAPDASGLMVDRLGMAITFAGAVAMALGERGDQATARVALVAILVGAVVSAILTYTPGNIVPWAVIQFGGMALIAWAAGQPRLSNAVGVPLGILIGLYALAKLCELNDEAIYRLSDEWVSGHTLKHLVAALAAWPVIATLMRQNAQAPLMPTSPSNDL